MKNTNSIFPKGENASPDFFTGTAYVNMLVADTDKQYNCQVYDEEYKEATK